MADEYSDIHFFQIYVNFHKAMVDRGINADGRGVVYDRVVDALRQILDEASFEYSTQYGDDDETKPVAAKSKPSGRAKKPRPAQKQREAKRPQEASSAPPPAAAAVAVAPAARAAPAQAEFSDVDARVVMKDVSEVVYGTNTRLNKVWSQIRGAAKEVDGAMLAKGLIKLGVEQPPEAIISACSAYMPNGVMTYGNFVKALK